MAASAVVVRDTGGAATLNRFFNRVWAVSCTSDMASASNNATATDTVAVPGVALGDFVMVSAGVSSAGTTVTGYVDAADSVTIVVNNNSGGAVNLASTTYRIVVMRPSF